MSISDVKEQVSSILAEKRSGGLARGGQMGLDKPAVPLKTVAISGVIGLAAFLVLHRMFAAPTAPAADTGNAQIDQAMQMLQQQQDINQKLMQGQQELSAQMIEAQSRAKTVQPSVNCIFAVCPGTARQEAAPDGQYAIVGEGIRTARVNPNQFMEALAGQAQQQSTPAPTRGGGPAVQQISAGPDYAEVEYQRLSTDMVQDWPRFMEQWNTWESFIISNSQQPTAIAFRRIAKEQGW